MMPTSLSRRNLLRAVGAAGLVAPFLGLSRPVRGAELPKRLILFHTANGLEPLRLTPPAFMTQLEDLLILDGVEWPGNFHVGNDYAHIAGTNASFTANIGAKELAAGPSIDRYLIDKLKPTTPFDSVDLGVHWNVNIANAGEGHAVNFSMAGDGIQVESNPRKAFDRLFATPIMGGADGAAAAARLRARKQSILDRISGELKTLLTQVTPEERVRLDGHLTSLRAIEKRLADSVTAPGGTTAPVDTKSLDERITTGGEAPDFPATGVLHSDILVLALAMGLTNFATLRWGHSVNEMTYPWTGTNRGFHAELAHGGGGAMNDFRKVLYWFADQYLALVNRLKTTADPSGSGMLLDSSLVLWNSDMCDGNHGVRNGIMVMAGRLGGSVRPGRIAKTPGASLNGIYAEVCGAMGVPTPAFGSNDVPNAPIGVLA